MKNTYNQDSFTGMIENIRKLFIATILGVYYWVYFQLRLGVVGRNQLK